MTDSDDPTAEYERLRGEAGDLFPVSLDRKVGVAATGLTLAASFGPAVAAQSADVRALEGGPGAPLNIVGGIAVLLGVVLLFVGAAALVSQRYYVGQHVDDEDGLKYFLRLEDLWMWLLLLGFSITTFCMLLILPATLSLVSAEGVSGAGFGIYSEFDPLPVVIGAWTVSAVAAGALVTLVAGWLWVHRTTVSDE